MSLREIRRQLLPRLEDLGLIAPIDGLVTYPFDADWVGVIGLSMATKHTSPGTALVLPLVGIIHYPTERLLSELAHDPPARIQVATVQRAIGEIGSPPQFLEWLVGGPHDESDQMIATIRDLALPFMSSLRSLPAILGEATAGYGARTEYITPVVLLQLGRFDEGLAQVQAKLVSMGDQSDAGSMRYRRFAESYELVGAS